MVNEARDPNLKEIIFKRLKEKTAELKISSSGITDAHFRRRIEAVFRTVLKENRIYLNPAEQDEIFSDVMSQLVGFGPIDNLLKNPEVSEIMVNGPKQIFIERNGVLELTDIQFDSDEHLGYFIDKMLSPLGRRVTEFEPYVDARLTDGARINIVRSPISSIGTVLTIRKFPHRILNINDLINFGSLDELAAEFLKACVVARFNILISGGASSGKTTLLNALSAFIPKTERVVVIEDTRELNFPREHTVYLEARPPSIEGKGEITIRNLVKNSLHMRPDRIIIGEVRSDEVLDMIQAMNTGHEGSMTTLHANSPLETLERLEVLTLMGSLNISSEVARRQIINAIDLIVNTVRFPNGARKIIQISEVLKGGDYALEDIFIMEEQSGKIRPTGKMPKFYLKLKQQANYIFREFSQEG
jgi:pilus assembly protein CpaF